MLNGLPGIDPVRRAELMKVLDVDPDWRMHTVSDGQRRRVQICLGLLKPFDVLLLDEITVDLDVLGRADLMQFLKEECEQRGATIIYVSYSIEVAQVLLTATTALYYGSKIAMYHPDSLRLKQHGHQQHASDVFTPLRSSNCITAHHQIS